MCGFYAIAGRISRLRPTGDVRVDGHAAGEGGAPEIMLELGKKSDGLVDWLKERDALTPPTDEAVLLGVREVLSRHPKLLDTRTGRSGADPMVIAIARLGGHIVVTGERFVANARPDRPRIPNVCDALSIPWLTIVGVIEREDWII